MTFTDQFINLSGQKVTLIGENMYLNAKS